MSNGIEDRLRGLAEAWTDVQSFVPAGLRTPALLVDAAAVEHNIRAVVAWIGDPARWRPHVKTTKTPWVADTLRSHGVARFKCATTRELAMLVEAGVPDVLLAMCVRGANARAVGELASRGSAVSVLVEGPEDLDEWQGVPVGVFIDVDAGLGRTGIPVTDVERIAEVARAAVARGLDLRGLHAYEGWPHAAGEAERRRIVDTGHDGLVAAVTRLEREGIAVGEISTSGSLSAGWAAEHNGLAGVDGLHTLSPGTVVYHDARTELESPWRLGFRPAAAVVTSVVSATRDTHVTCDAGHKSIGADVGDPIGLVAGRPELALLSPSEEHLPLRVDHGAKPPSRGQLLTVIPMHVCSTVNLHDVALLYRDGGVEQVLEIMRGHDAPLRTR